MFRKVFFFLFFFTLGLSLELSARAVVFDEKAVTKVEVLLQTQAKGQSFDEESVLQRLQTQKNKLFMQNDFDQDLKLLASEFDRVEPQIEVQEDSSLKVSILVWEKPKIREITFSGNQKIKTTRLEKEFATKRTSLFDRQSFVTNFHKLRDYYIQKGYFNAELDYHLSHHPQENEISIHIQIKEGLSGVVRKFLFEGTEKQEESEILDAILTKPHNVFTSWITGAGTIKDELLNYDKMTIIEYYQNKGYADVEVDISTIAIAGKDRVDLKVEVKKGKKYFFGKLSFSGNSLFENKKIEEFLKIKEASAYSPKKLRQITQKLSELYGSKGYIEAFISYEPTLKNETSYDVEFKIDEGLQYRVGIIRVHGNKRTFTSVILHETLLTPGDIFRLDRLDKSEKRLMNINYFKSVNIFPVKSELASEGDFHYRDVHIEIEEGDTANIGLSAGFSTSENLFAGFDLLEHNFNYKGLSKLFSKGYPALRGAGEYVHLKGSFGRLQSSYLLSWTKPHFRDTPWTVGVDLDKMELNKGKSKEHGSEAYGLSLYGHYSYNAFVGFRTHLRLRDLRMIIRDTGNSLLNQQLERERGNNGKITGIGGQVAYDSTNHPYKASKGLRSVLEAEFISFFRNQSTTGSNKLGSNSNFLKVQYINSYYLRLFKKGILRYRLDLRFIEPLESIPNRESIAFDTFPVPIGERFFLGGESSVRGYRAYALGPKYPDSEDQEPMGGISSTLLSLEYLQELHKKIDAFVFADAGHVSLERRHIGKLNYSLGLGLRMMVLPGAPPIAVGVGFPQNANNRPEVRRFFLSLGAKF